MKTDIHPTYYTDAKVTVRILRQDLDYRFHKKRIPRGYLLELPSILYR